MGSSIGGLKSKKAGDGPKWWCHENDSSAARRVRANAGAARDGQANQYNITAKRDITPAPTYASLAPFISGVV